jgi:hypothetical protein
MIFQSFNRSYSKSRKKNTKVKQTFVGFGSLKDSGNG